MALLDALHRPLLDLRISVTDRCNFRCRYCMPREHFGADHTYLSKTDILTYEEITSIASSIRPLGLRKVRITGGEPLIRKDIATLIEMLRALDPQLDLALTTNGILLAKHAKTLKEAGLNRVTVSLDALDEGVFKAMGDTEHSPEEVVEGIDAALRVGLGVKVNMVVQRNVNENQVGAIAKMAHERNLVPRYIEFMDVGTTNQWNMDSVVSGEEIRQMLSKTIGPLKQVDPFHPSDVAKRWQTENGQQVGMIQSVTAPFCGDCSRARISANGSLYTCLFATNGNDLRSLIRLGAGKNDLTEAIKAIWTQRNDRYSEQRGEHDQPVSKIEMSFIGG